MTHIQSQRVSQRVDFLLIPPVPTASDPMLETSNATSNHSQLSDEEKVEDPPGTRSTTFSRLGLSKQTGWGFELLASTLSLVTFIVLIVILKYYDGRAQKEWQYNHLTLNGLVALLSTICRAALLIPIAAALSQGKWLWYSRDTAGKPLDDFAVFDEASRGALGSIRLLCRIRGRHLVSFGALLTILALAFDTFSQQVISVDFLYVQDTSTSAIASVPRSEVYNRTLNATNRAIPMADLPMQAALWTGFLRQDISELPVYCSTGNCTWPIIPTLGMCSDCTDVTSNLTYSCNSTHCTYSLPSGNSITGPSSDSSSTGNGVVFRIAQTIGTVYKPNDSGHPLYVLHTEAIGVPWQAPEVLIPNTNVAATECAFWYCVQAYNVSVTHGRHFQQTIGTWSKAEKDGTFVDLPSEFNVAPNVTFRVSDAAYKGFVILLSNLMSQGVTIYKVKQQNLYSHDSVLAFWQASQDWNKWASSLALSITNTIRSTAPADNTTTVSQYYAGKSYTTASYIRVRWPWLAFPALMVVASVLFLLLSIWETRRNRVNGWKASPLPLLFTDVDEELVRRAEGAMSVEDFKGAVGSERVLLEKDTDGRWHFRLGRV